MASADDYCRASLARLGDAQALRDAGRWSGSSYMAGRAAEALLRALLRLKTRANESGHDLRELLKQVDHLGSRSPRDGDALRNQLNDLVRLWHNNLRFDDDESLLRDIKVKKLDRGVRGDPLEVWTRRMVNAATGLQNRGTLVWLRSKRR